ncbi:hypothetical protein Fmac_015270 [Flemingia macrophylla]|uniref:Uncharacterized protein n=1 Tax=Flemingia macrophylla TaxID=520843 RepID=A0ABD1ME65_9FABA
MSILRLMLQTPIADHHSCKDKTLDREDASQILALEGRLEALVNLVTQLAANQKSASLTRVSDIHSSNDHHTSVSYFFAKHSRVDEHPEAYAANTYSRPPQSNRDKALDGEDGPQLLASTSAKTRKLEGKLDALLNLVTQLAANQKPAYVARVCDIRSSNDHHTSVCPSSQQSGFSARNDAIVIRGVHDVATDTSAQTRKLEGKLDALVNLVTQLSTNQKLASIARVFGIHSSNHHHTRVCPSSQQSRVDEYREGYAIHLLKQGKLEGKLDSLLNLVTQLAANHKPAFIARGCGIRSSNDHHTSFSARNDAIVIRGVHDMATDTFAETRKLEGKMDALVNLTTIAAETRGVHDVATDTSAKTRKLEGKLDALVNLVTQVAANQKPASIARVCGIRSSNDHHTSVCPSSLQSRVDEDPKAYATNTYSRPPQQLR